MNKTHLVSDNGIDIVISKQKKDGTFVMIFHDQNTGKPQYKVEGAMHWQKETVKEIFENGGEPDVIGWFADNATHKQGRKGWIKN